MRISHLFCPARTPLVLGLSRLNQLFWRRIDGQCAVGAIQDELNPVFKIVQLHWQADGCRYTDAAGQDGRVRGRATPYRAKSQDLAPFELNRVGGSQILGDDNHRPIWQVDSLWRDAEQAA